MYEASSASAVRAAEHYCETLSGCGGCVSESVERIGAVAYLGAEAAHFGISAGIVGDRSVGIRCQRDAQRREHSDGGDADTVETHAEVAGREHVGHVEVDAHRYDRMIATPIVMTGMAVEIIPRPIPEIMTVAGPVFALSAMRRVGRYECEV